MNTQTHLLLAAALWGAKVTAHWMLSGGPEEGRGSSTAGTQPEPGPPSSSSAARSLNSLTILGLGLYVI